MRVAPRSDRIIRLVSERVHASAAFALEGPTGAPSGDWTDYAGGVIAELLASGVAIGGCDAYVCGDVPIGAGLSSSASFEVALALALLRSAGSHLAPLELARLCRRVETDRVGIRSGIMDPCAVLLGRANHALLLDTRSLEFGQVPVPRAAAIVICNTMVRHRLAAGEYNRRRAECEAAVEVIRRLYPQVTALRDVTLEQLALAEPQMAPEIYRRARHVVTENARVLATAQALRTGDLPAAGALMNASHDSLRDDYEVSCEELDLMAELARRSDGVYGARMTGGGFGGCTVNLVDAQARDEFTRRIATAYRHATGIAPEIYDGTPVDGAA